MNKSIVSIRHWNAEHSDQTTFDMEVDDRRADGQLFVQVSTSSDEPLIGLGLVVEINDDDAKDIPATPCVHLQHNGETVASVFYSQGELLLRREDGTPGLLRLPTLSVLQSAQYERKRVSRDQVTYYCPRGCQTFTTAGDPGECGACGSRFSSDDAAYNSALQSVEDRQIARSNDKEDNE